MTRARRRAIGVAFMLLVPGALASFLLFRWLFKFWPWAEQPELPEAKAEERTR